MNHIDWVPGDDPQRLAILKRMAESDRPSVWTFALLRAGGRQHLTAAFPDSQILHRRRAALGLAGERLSAADQAEAARLLPGLLRPQLLALHREGFVRVLDRIARTLPPADATPMLVDFLERLIEDSSAWEFFNHENTFALGVERVVKQLNRWHGTNLGGLGDDLDQSSTLAEQFDWPVIAREAVDWAREREPSAAPAGP